MTLDLATMFPCPHERLENGECMGKPYNIHGPNGVISEVQDPQPWCPGYSEPNFQEAVQRLVEAATKLQEHLHFTDQEIWGSDCGTAHRNALRPFIEKGTE